MVRQRRTTTLAKAGFDSGYLYDLSLFRFLSIRLQKGCLFLHAHVTAVSAVMVPGYGFYSPCPVLCGELGYIGSMDPCCCRRFLRTLSRCSQLRRIQSFFRSLFFPFSRCCYDLPLCFTVSVHFFHSASVYLFLPSFCGFYQPLCLRPSITMGTASKPYGARPFISVDTENSLSEIYFRERKFFTPPMSF